VEIDPVPCPKTQVPVPVEEAIAVLQGEEVQGGTHLETGPRVQTTNQTTVGGE
jgi:hypothetical protein